LYSIKDSSRPKPRPEEDYDEDNNYKSEQEKQQYIRTMAKDYNDTIESLLKDDPDSFVGGVAVIVEWRICNAIVSTIYNAIDNLPSDWIIQVFHGQHNSEFLRGHPKLTPLVDKKKLFFNTTDSVVNVPGTGDVASYNRLFTSESFWDMMMKENVIIFQLDSRFCSNSPHKIEEFLGYSYIGAPWFHHTCWGTVILVGNGGLSFRKRSVMKKVLQIKDEFLLYINTNPRFYPCRDVEDAEDTLFAFGVYYLAKIKQVPGYNFPSVGVASKFSYENPHPNEYSPTFGIHKANDMPKSLKQWCPEIDEARQPCTSFDSFKDWW